MLEYHPIVQEVLRLLDVWRHRFAMRTFGAPTEKPTWLYSSHLNERLVLFGMTLGCLTPQYYFPYLVSPRSKNNL